MEAAFITAETEKSNIFHVTIEEESQTLSSPAQVQSEKDEGASAQKDFTSSTQEPTPLTNLSVSEELQLLKRRIDELAKQSPNGGTDSHTEQPVAPGSDDRGSKVSAEQIEYQKMLACLYGHRKQFETTEGPGDWDLIRIRNDYVPRQRRDGPWDNSYHLWERNQYRRPNAFDLDHQCDNQQPNFGVEDDYDIAISYGDRRERVRKHFEWELDRLYLMEEMRNRQIRRKKEEELERLHAQEPNFSDAVPNQGAPSNPGGETGDPAEGEHEQEITVMETQLIRLQWHAFKRATVAIQVGCQIDVLVGEPVVQDDLVAGYATWFGYSGQAPQKISKVDQSTTVITSVAGESPLPERVRIYSGILINIIAKIVGSDSGSLNELQDSPVVFIRPFKVLAYCEQALRDWCTALRRRYALPPVADAEKPVSQEAPTVSGDNVTTVPASESADDQIAPEMDSREDNEEEAEEKGEDEDESTKSQDALRHLECLLQFIDADIASKRSHLRDSQSRKVFFSDLWHLFRPGMEVISSNGKQVYRVVHVCSARHQVVPAWNRYAVNNKSVRAPFSLVCIHIDFDGKSLGPISTSFEFKRFDGQRDITSLDVYPLKFHPVRKADFDENEWPKVEALSLSERSSLLRQRFVDRGKLFLQVAQVKHMYYAGPTVGVRDEVESQVVIDFETAFAVEDPKQQAWKPNLEILLGNPGTKDDDDSDERGRCQAVCCRNDLVHDDMYIDEKQRTEYIDSLLPKEEHSDQQPSIAIIHRPLNDLRTGAGKPLAVTDDELLIMSYRVFGFVLRTRKWAQLDISYLTEVHARKHEPKTAGRAGPNTNNETNEPTTFSRLVLNEKHKHMIMSLIAQHFRDKKSTGGQREQVDIVRGKGKGLILLLHGAPGVGKTSTAEGVAEHFQKPLFQITCGDLGTTAAEVEKALETTFALANRWDCILLLDEADVFLSQRTKDDFQRNGLVAVFLRVMEYYAGILFLTTNRVGDFDEAFTSRIHVSLYYPDLSAKQTVEIFKLNLGMIKERFLRKGRQIKIDEVDIILFAQKYFDEHPHGRWNGRQIRNACQTALALAEYEAQAAQGDDPQSSVKTDASVDLTVAQFVVVSDAYLEFINYINQLFGTNSARKAHEDGLRAFLANNSDNIVANLVDKRAAFSRSVQPQQPSHPQHQYPAPGAVAPAPEPYYGYYQPAPTGHLNPNAMAPQRQAYGSNEAWNSMPQSAPRDSHTPDPTLIPSQHSPQSRMQVPRTTQYPNQPMPPSYTEPELQYSGREHPGSLSSLTNSNQPAQAWPRDAGAH